MQLPAKGKPAVANKYGPTHGRAAVNANINSLEWGHGHEQSIALTSSDLMTINSKRQIPQVVARTCDAQLKLVLPWLNDRPTQFPLKAVTVMYCNEFTSDI
jgi:hypothetical protein